MTKDGQIVEFMGGLSLDLMDDFQNRFLINSVQLGIKLWPNKKEFCLLSAEENADYKVNIVGAKLYIPAGQYSFSADDLYLGAVPSHLIVTITPSEGFNGSYKKNPFNFQSFDCGYVGFFY